MIRGDVVRRCAPCSPGNAVQSSVDRSAVEAADSRADRSEAYRDARAEYARIPVLA